MGTVCWCAQKLQKEADFVCSETRRPRAGLQLCTGLDHFTFIAPLCATVGSPALEYYRSCFTYPCGVFWAFEELMKMLRLPGNPVRHVRLRGHTQTKHIVKIIVLKDLVNAFFLTCEENEIQKSSLSQREISFLPQRFNERCIFVQLEAAKSFWIFPPNHIFLLDLHRLKEINVLFPPSFFQRTKAVKVFGFWKFRMCWLGHNRRCYLLCGLMPNLFSYLSFKLSFG